LRRSKVFLPLVLRRAPDVNKVGEAQLERVPARAVARGRAWKAGAAPGRVILDFAATPIGINSEKVGVCRDSVLCNLPRNVFDFRFLLAVATLDSPQRQVRMVERAEIVLHAAEGHSAAKIGRLLGDA